MTVTTLDDVIVLQKTKNVLEAPSINVSVNPALTKSYTTAIAEGIAATPASFQVGLYNGSASNTVYAHIVGNAINNNNAIVFLQSDGVTQYFPADPSSNGTSLAVNVAIPLGEIGSTTQVTIPYISSGRIYFSLGTKMTFLLNTSTTGAQIVAPSVSNTTDPNYNISWDFCEFTYNSTQMFMNVTYCDFVSIPTALTLTNTSGASSHVSGILSNGLSTISNGLIAQAAADGSDWKNLIIKDGSGNILRILSPIQGVALNSSWFANYWTNYITQCWNFYKTTPLVVDTQPMGYSHWD